jgi:hypothetical protein
MISFHSSRILRNTRRVDELIQCCRRLLRPAISWSIKLSSMYWLSWRRLRTKQHTTLPPQQTPKPRNGFADIVGAAVTLQIWVLHQVSANETKELGVASRAHGTVDVSIVVAFERLASRVEQTPVRSRTIVNSVACRNRVRAKEQQPFPSPSSEHAVTQLFLFLSLLQSSQSENVGLHAPCLSKSTLTRFSLPGLQVV